MDMIKRDNWRPVEYQRADDTSDKPSAILGTAAVFFDSDNRAATEFQLWPGAVERIMPTAFDRALADGDDVLALFNHDSSRILGRSSSGTLQLQKRDGGLHYRVDASTTSTFLDVAEHLSRGDVSGSSFAFLFDKGGERWTKEGDLEVREVHSVRLYDVGPVATPAYAGTSSFVREARGSYDAWQAGRLEEYQRRQMDVYKRQLDLLDSLL